MSFFTKKPDPVPLIIKNLDFDNALKELEKALFVMHQYKLRDFKDSRVLVRTQNYVNEIELFRLQALSLIKSDENKNKKDVTRAINALLMLLEDPEKNSAYFLNLANEVIGKPRKELQALGWTMIGLTPLIFAAAFTALMICCPTMPVALVLALSISIPFILPVGMFSGGMLVSVGDNKSLSSSIVDVAAVAEPCSQLKYFNEPVVESMVNSPSSL